MLSPYARFLGPAWFRRFLAERVPDPNFQRIKSIVDTMHASSQAIYEEKKAALLRGDEAILRQVGQGKDIMSILRK